MDRTPQTAQPMSSAGRRGLYVETEPFDYGWMTAGRPRGLPHSS